MKIEFLYHYRRRHRLAARERLIAYLPRYAPLARRARFLLNLRDRFSGLSRLDERLLGFSARRRLPAWRRDAFLPDSSVGGAVGDMSVVLLVDTFNTYFEPENARAALAVLRAAGHDVHLPRPEDAPRPLCCGRTFFSTGMIDEARAEARRTIRTLRPYVERGVAVVGLEPSCLLTLRDEFPALLPGRDTSALARQALLFEEFLAREHDAGRLRLALRPLRGQKALLHGHCHQKAFGAMTAVEKTLRLVPGLDVTNADTGCCGMAGAFGYEAEHYDMSMKMGELSVLPAARRADAHTLIVADGTSCRAQIRYGADREAVHVVRVLASALNGGES